MISPNPHNSYFRLLFPHEFFIDSVIQKYDKYLEQYDWPLKNMKSVFLESFQGTEFPGFGYQPVTQNLIDVNNAGYDWNQPPKTSEQLLASQKVLELTFRHTDAFITYFFALETFFKRFQMGPDNETERKPFGPLILETLDTMSKDPVCRLKFHKCNIIGLSPLTLTYADPQRKMDTFVMSIAYTEFETTLTIPSLVLK